MRIIFSEHHSLHNGRSELIGGTLKPCFESPRRAEIILACLRESGYGDISPPSPHGREPIEKVHKSNFVEFLERAWKDWTAEGRDHDALPLNWQVRGMRDKEPETIDGKLSYFSFDAGTPIMAGTWQAATSAADVALTGVDHLVSGASAAFALCRPPGHHAAADYYGGYCFLNNAAIAAQAFVDRGLERIAVLDVDYHHGNGTQSIFYARNDVLFVSIHGDPRQEYPFFLGYEDETGAGPGEDCNLNLPLRRGASAAQWFEALDVACRRIRSFGSDALVVSLGVDTFEHDPISQFRLKTDDYLQVGRRIAGLGLPSLFVMEGGYAVDALGVNVANVLTGFSEE